MNTHISSAIKKIVLYSILSLFIMYPSTILATANIGAVGTIQPPPGTQEYITASGVQQGEVAVLFFISRLINLIMIVAGGWSTVMILLSSYNFITSQGNKDSYQKVRNQLTNAVIGLMLIMITYTITGLISLIIFGDAAFILNPTL